MVSRSVLFVLFLMSTTSCFTPTQKQTITIGYVNDYSAVFTDSQRTVLTHIIDSFDKATTNQIALATVDSITPHTDIMLYATELGNNWGVGTKEKNNGLIIVLCKPCRNVGMASGTGTELILTDAILNRIIQEEMIPYFKQDDYFTGIYHALYHIIREWSG